MKANPITASNVNQALQTPSTQSVSLWFDGLPPNPNSRRHWRKVYADNQEWKQTAFILAKNAYKGRPFEFAHVAYTFSVGDNRAHDLDNLIASTKPLTDGLKGVLFVDDDIDSITVSYDANRNKPRGIRVVVTRTAQEPL